MIKKLAYVSIIASLIGKAFLSIEMGPFDLTIFRIILFLTLLVLYAYIVLNKGKITLPVYPRNRYSIFMFLAWLTYALLTIAWVKDYPSWVRAIYFLVLGVICIIIYVSVFKTKEDVLIAFRLMAVMAIVHNIIGWYEIVVGSYPYLAVEKIAKYHSTGNPISTFRNTNDYATFMLFSVFIAYICAANTKRKDMKLLYVALMASSGYMVVQTSSRANILGLVLACFVFIVLYMKDRNWRHVLMALLPILFVVVLFKLDDITSLTGKYLYFDFVSNRGSDYVRMNLIKDGLIFLKKTFGFGTGAGNIEYWMKNFGVYYKSNILRMHNWWMEILVGYGIIIFVLYLIFYIKLCLDMFITYQSSGNKRDKSISLGILCCAVGFIVGSISASSNISVEWLWCFWAICIVYQGVAGKPRQNGKVQL